MSLCRDRIFLCCDRVLAKAKRFLITTAYFRLRQTLAKTKRVSCRHRVWSRPRALCCDKAICVVTEVGRGQGILCRDRISLCGVATEYFMP